MKQFTIKELATQVNISEGTIRAWIMKPVDGQPYSSESINYANLQEKLAKYFPEFEKQFGFAIADIEIVKAQRTTKNWLTVDELAKLESGSIITLHNYSLKTELMFLGYIEEHMVYLFSTTGDTKPGYKAYDVEQLQNENIKMEVKA